MSDTQHKNPIITTSVALADKFSVDAYAPAGVFDVRLFKTKHVVNQAVTNNLKVTIFGSVDGGVTYPLTAVSEFTITAGTATTNTVTVYYTHLRVDVKAAVGAAQGTLSTQMAAASF